MPRLLLPVFFASGSAGLIYQVVWMRHAALQLGATTVAVGTVVATFLAGLALGSLLGGRWMDRRLGDRPAAYAARTYAVLEGGIAVWALLFAPLLSLLTPLAGLLYSGGGESGFLFNALRILICALLILPPTMAMGATLPILSRFAACFTDESSRAAGWLYSLNTLGAVAGAAMAGWILIPFLGLSGATLCAVALNALAAGGAMLLARETPAPFADEPDPTSEIPRWILPVYAASGFAALIYEVSWTQALILAFGSSVYAFSLVLSCFILGIGVGSALATRLAGRLKDVVLIFAVLQTGIGVVAAATVPALQYLPIMMIKIAGTTDSFASLLLAELGFAALIILVPSILMGAMFPLLCRLVVGSRRDTGRAVGTLYAWNTAGNILGTLAAAFLLLPWVGIRISILLAAALNLILASLVFAKRPSGTRSLQPLLPLAALPLFFFIPSWDLSLMTVTPPLYAKHFMKQSRLTDRNLSDILREQSEIVYSRWDATGLVTVHVMQETLVLRINGKADASSGADMATQLLLGHLPLVMHPNPNDVLVVGLGSGGTLSAVLKHEVEFVDAVEISPAVVEASEAFAELLEHPLKDPRAQMLVTDARSHTRFTDRKYDVIIAEPSNLWIRGMATLFTREQFQLYKDRLKSGGVVCQWIHAYRLPRRDFAAVLETFRSVFPKIMLFEWSVGQDYLILGFDGEMPDYASVRRRFERPEVKAQLNRWGVTDLPTVMRCWVASGEGIEGFSSNVPVITDDHCYVEYSSPFGLLEAERADILRDLDGARESFSDKLKGGPDLAEVRKGRRALARAVAKDGEEEVEEAMRLLSVAVPLAGGDPALAPAVFEITNRAFIRALEAERAGRKEEAVRLREKARRIVDSAAPNR